MVEVFDDDGFEGRIDEDDTYKGCVKRRKTYMKQWVQNC
jgi:hypothetical protein